MKKKIFLTLLAFVCILCCALGLAACNNGDGNDSSKYLTFRLKDDDTYAVSSDFDKRFKITTDKVTQLTIPAEYNGKSVTSIDDNALQGVSRLAEVILPDSITSIGKQAFNTCHELTSINLSNSLTSIGDAAFGNCTSLTSITLPNTVTTIGENAFINTGLTSITLPNSVTRIENYTFMGCNNLTSISLPNSVTYLGKYVFGDGENSTCAIKNLELPDSLTEIELGALSGCKNLESLTLKFPEDYTLGRIFGGGNTSLKTVTVKSGEFVGGFNGGGFTALKNIILYDGVTLRTDDVFNDCPALEYYEYGNCLYLGNDTNKYLFLIKAKNTDIVSCSIHESTRAICSSAFNNCNKLTTVEVSNFEFKKASSKTSEKISLKNLFNLSNEISTVKTIKVAYGVTYLPENSINFALTELVLPISLTEIAGNAIADSNKITTIRFVGTKAQFKNIEMNWGWCGGSSVSNDWITIHCDDEDISVSWYGQIWGE